MIGDFIHSPPLRARSKIDASKASNSAAVSACRRLSAPTSACGVDVRIQDVLPYETAHGDPPKSITSAKSAPSTLSRLNSPRIHRAESEVKTVIIRCGQMFFVEI